MAFTKDFLTLMAEHNLRSDCESCHFCTGTGCPKHERPDKSPVDAEGVCCDWIDAESLLNYKGNRRLCLLCDKVKNRSHVKANKPGCDKCLGIKTKRSTNYKWHGKGRQDGDICRRCGKPGYYNTSAYICVDCETEVRREQRLARYAQGLTARGTPYKKPCYARRAQERVVQARVA
jgi:hypothetical protein